jgi:hypothetical protein
MLVIKKKNQLILVIELCLANATKVFNDADWSVIADNVSEPTENMIRKYVPTEDSIDWVSVGHGAGTFNLALDEALTYDDDEIIYFIENDYLHKPNQSTNIRRRDLN